MAVSLRSLLPLETLALFVGGRVHRLRWLHGFASRCFSNHPQGLLLLFEAERIAASQAAHSLPTPADSETKELPRHGIHAVVRLAVEGDPQRAHQWIPATHGVFVTGQEVA